MKRFTFLAIGVLGVFMALTFMKFSGNTLLGCWNCGSSNLAWKWGLKADGPDFNQGKSVSVNNNNDVYVTGYFSGTTTFGSINNNTITLTANSDKNVFVAKYNASGNVQWVKQATNGSPDANGSGWGISVDGSGNSYITGGFTNSLIFSNGVTSITLKSKGGMDMFVAKYDNNGNFLWAHRGGGSSVPVGNWSTSDLGTSIRLGTNRIFVTGHFFQDATFGESPNITVLPSGGDSTDMFLASYDLNGNLLWVKSAGGDMLNGVNAQGGGALDQGARGMSVSSDTADNVYVAGGFHHDADFGTAPNIATLSEASNYEAGFIVKYNKNGDILWARKIDSFWPNTDFFISFSSSVTVDKLGNVIVTGVTRKDLPSPFIAFIIKLNPSGSLQWLKQSSSLGNAGNTMYSMPVAVDGANNIYVSGGFDSAITFANNNATSLSGGGFSSLYFYKFYPNGNFLAKNLVKSTGGAIPNGVWGQSLIGLDVGGSQTATYITTGFQGDITLTPNLSLTSSVNDIFSSNMFLGKLQ